MDYVDRFIDNISHMSKRDKIVKFEHMITYSSKEYFIDNRVYDKFLRVLDKGVLDKTLASSGASHFVHDWDVVEKHFKSLSMTGAGKALMRMPFSSIDKLVPLRDDDSIRLKLKTIKQLILCHERTILIKYSDKIIPTTYFGYHPDLWRQIGIDAMICEVNINRNYPVSRMLMSMINNLHGWIWNNSNQKIFELFSVMRLQDIPDEYYLKRGDVVPIDDPADTFSRLKIKNYVTENILRIFLLNFPKSVPLNDIISEGSIGLAIEHYDPESNFSWAPYAAQLVNMLDDSPGVLQILKTIDTNILLRNGKNISKMPWIKSQDMVKYFKDLELREDSCCVICLDNISEIDAQVKTRCGHVYHYECFTKIPNKFSCPMCRQQML